MKIKRELNKDENCGSMNIEVYINLIFKVHNKFKTLTLEKKNLRAKIERFIKHLMFFLTKHIFGKKFT